MAKSFGRKLATATLSVGLLIAVADLAAAKGGPKGGFNGMGGGHGFGNAHAMAPSFSTGRRTGWQGATRPPGWSHGRKVGWRGGKVPPGLR
jgi:hypothetical protein